MNNKIFKNLDLMGGMKWYNHASERRLSSHQSGETDIYIRENIIKKLGVEKLNISSEF